MIVSMAWRNLSRNLRRSILTGGAVTFGVVLIFWMRGFQDGSYAQMIDQAVQTRLGHYQVLGEGYLERPEPRTVVPEAAAVVSTLQGLDHVEGVSARAVAEGMVARDNESAQVEILGVDPEAESRASNVPGKLFQGEVAVRWCRSELAEAQEIMGGDEGLFERWCDAMGSSVFLPEDNDRAVVLGSGLAETLLVSVGDEVTVQVVRAVAGDGTEQGELSQRRLEITGFVRTGNAEVDDRIAYVRQDTLTGMLGTDGPNEIVVLLDDIGNLAEARERARQALAGNEGVAAYTWNERNPALFSLIEADSQGGNMMYIVLFLLVALGVINATFMSVLERTKEFGVMLALGTRRAKLFYLVMVEVGLLGFVSIAIGAALGLGLEIFGRTHGWPLEWFGYEAMDSTSMAGVVYDDVYYSALTVDNAVVILVGVYTMFLLAGLLPAIRASRLAPVEAMRVK